MSQPWMPLYVADYLADTGRLSTVEHGAYMLLIMDYWRNGGVPDDDRKLARIARMSDAEWMAIRDNIADLFQDGWKHKRIDAEIARSEEKSKLARASAMRRHSVGNANAVRTQSEGTAKAHANDMLSQSQLQIEKKDTEANASDAVPSSPKYIDAKHELWGEGKRLLGELDIPQSRCGALIGGWCKETGDNYAGVLDAIARAREAKPLNPIPWIVQALPHKAKKNVEPQPSRLRQFIKDFIGDEENEQDGGGCETVVNGNVLMLSNGNK